MGVFPAMLPADIEALAEFYLNIKMPTLDKGTALPRTPDNSTKPAPYLMLEFAGGPKTNEIEWDLDVIIHSYAPTIPVASLNARTATAHMDSASGEKVDGWFVGWARCTSLPARVDDPRFATRLVRYRSMVTWRVTAQPITP